MSIQAGGTQRKRGAEAVTDELKPKPEKKFDPSVYSCEIILEKTTLDKSQDRKLPTDAFNVTYIVDGETRLDVTRAAKQVHIFYMYYVNNDPQFFVYLILKPDYHQKLVKNT